MTPDLDHWLPKPSLRVAHQRASRVPPAELWEAARSVRIADAGVLGRLVRWRIPGTGSQMSFEELFSSPPFMVLAQEGGGALAQEGGGAREGDRLADLDALEGDRLADLGGRALVSGLVGRIWTLRRDYPRLSDPQEFREWSKRGTARVVFANWVQPADGGGATLHAEARVQALGAQGRVGLAAVRPLIRAFHPLVGSDGIAAAVRLAESRPVRD